MYNYSAGFSRLFVLAALTACAQAQTCSNVLTPSAADYPFTGGTGVLNVQIGAGCYWQVNRYHPALEFTSATTGTGPGTVSFKIHPGAEALRIPVAANDGPFIFVNRAGMPNDLQLVAVAPPSNVAVGTGSTGRFVLTFPLLLSGQHAVTDIGLLITTGGNDPNACAVAYERQSSSAQVVPGSACRVVSSSSSERTTTGGAVRDVTLDLEFTGYMAGTTQLFTRYTLLDAATSNWVPMGAFEVGPPAMPSVVSLQPIAGVGSATFVATYSHPGGVNSHYLLYLLLLPLPNQLNYTAQNTCLVEYNRISGAYRLINDAGNDWSAPSKSGTVTNMVCTLNVSNSSVVVNGNQITMNAALSFQPGQKVFGTFLQEQDVKGRWSPMTQFGNWQAHPAEPYNPAGPFVFITQVSPNIATLVTHTGGHDKIDMVHVRIGQSIMDPNSCHVVVFPQTNTANLVSADGATLVSPTNLTLGTAGLLDNGRCSVDLAQSSLYFHPVGTQGRIWVTLKITPGAMFKGQKFVYVNVFDTQGLLTHWITSNVWNIP
jgi:hypothetical protein